MSKPKKTTGLSGGSKLTVVHAGADPTEVNKRNYISDNPNYETPKRVGEGLPKLPKVSKPQGLTATTPSRPVKVSRSVMDANNKDLKSRNIK